MEELRLAKELRELTIDPEFRDLIPSLTDEERRLLEESIVANGCESPLTVWNNTIVDGHNRYDICRKHSIPFAVLEKDFADRDAALLWMIQAQLGRRNLTAYQKTELALRFEPLLKAQARERQGRRTDMMNIPQNSSESSSDTETRKQIGKLAGVSHDTIKKVKKLNASADDETKRKLRRGEVTINGAYTELMKKEHAGETKTCERCHQEKPVSDFNIPSKRHDFSALCKKCEAEVDAAAKAAAEVAAHTTEPVETQPLPGMAMYKGAPIHVATPLPDEPDMFKHIMDLVKFAGDSFLANIKTAMRLYTGGMASETNNDAILELLDGIATQAEQIVENRLKEMENHE